jgi:hypothetical protein
LVQENADVPKVTSSSQDSELIQAVSIHYENLSFVDKVDELGNGAALFNDWQLRVFDEREMLIVFLVHQLVLPYTAVFHDSSLKLNVRSLKHKLKLLQVVFEDDGLQFKLKLGFEQLVKLVLKHFHQRELVFLVEKLSHAVEDRLR